MGITMKLVKGISLFVVFSLLLLVLGFYGGVKTSHFFYPGEQGKRSSPAPVEQLKATESPEEFRAEDVGASEVIQQQEESPDAPGWEESSVGSENALEIEDPRMQDDSFDFGTAWEADGGEVKEVSGTSETLCVDTKYVLEETDMFTHSVVETVWRLPDKYVGMNREQFLEAMEVYEAFPPLSEMERGFAGLEVLSFSREKVVIRMNYRFVQPSASFYLGVHDNKVTVYLEDKETVYIETDIRLDSLPGQIQHSIMQMMWVENQEKLYNFLENYSS